MKINDFKHLLSLFLISVINANFLTATAAPLDLDTSFGFYGNGRIETSLAHETEGTLYHLGTGVLANNKVVTLTNFKKKNTSQKIYELVRYNENGNPDSGFGVGGSAFLDNLVHHQAHEMVVEEDGTVIVVGRANILDTANTDVFAARYLPNGLPDPSFGNGGITIIKNIPEMKAFSIHGATMSDGSVVLAAGNGDIVVLRLTSSGQKGIPYKTVTNLNGKVAVMDMEVDGYDRTVVVGDYIDPFFNQHKVIVARYTTSGILDVNNFTPGNCIVCGIAIINAYETHPNLSEGAFANTYYQMDVAVNKPHNNAAYNKIVVSGSFGIIRLNDNGNFDITFNGNGRVQNSHQFVNSLLPGHQYVEIRSDGKIASLNNLSSTLTLYTEDGQLALTCTGSSLANILESGTSTTDRDQHSLNISMKIDTANRVVVTGTSFTHIQHVDYYYYRFAERYQGDCRPRFQTVDYRNYRDVHPFVHPQDIVGPEWKIRF